VNYKTTYNHHFLNSQILNKKRIKYRYSFQAQEHDDEIKGIGNSINYKYRMHDTRLGRFFAVDPLAAKYPWNSPYAFSENRVIDGVELEGLEVRIYTDKTLGMPHTFISVIDAEGIIHVFTYGQYNQEGKPWSGDGALVHLVGSDANNYIKEEFENYPMQVFEISEDLVNAQKTLDYYLNIVNGESRQEATNPKAKDEPNAMDFATLSQSKSILFKKYALLPNEISTENCTSCVLDGIREGGVNGFNLDYILPIPYNLNYELQSLSIQFPKYIKDVTEEEKLAAEYNLNAEDISKSALSFPAYIKEENAQQSTP
jgi:RHS repeat-associated protein